MPKKSALECLRNDETPFPPLTFFASIFLGSELKNIPRNINPLGLITESLANIREYYLLRGSGSDWLELLDLCSGLLRKGSSDIDILTPKLNFGGDREHIIKAAVGVSNDIVISTDRTYYQTDSPPPPFGTIDSPQVNTDSISYKLSAIQLDLRQLLKPFTPQNSFQSVS